MSPSQNGHSTKDHQAFPTSPWTETYQAAPQPTAEQSTARPAAKRFYDSDTQEPTHHALSDIYNRPY